MSGRNTKIANSKLGAPRFAKHEGNPNSEVIVYQLPPEKIKEQYGAGPASILTKEKFEELNKQKMSWHRMAEDLNIPYAAVKYLASKYRNMPLDFAIPVKRDKREGREAEVEPIQSEPMERTQENYVLLKEEGLKDSEIARRFGIKHPTLSYLKKKWELSADKEEQPESDEVDVVELESELDHSSIMHPEQPETPLETVFKPGHYESLSLTIGRLVDEKNAAYGDAFSKTGDFLKLLYPNGIKPDQYTDALCLVRIFDKQMRIATRKDAFGESPYRDITGYGLLGVKKDEMSRL